MSKIDEIIGKFRSRCASGKAVSMNAERKGLNKPRLAILLTGAIGAIVILPELSRDLREHQNPTERTLADYGSRPTPMLGSGPVGTTVVESGEDLHQSKLSSAEFSLMAANERAFAEENNLTGAHPAIQALAERVKAACACEVMITSELPVGRIPVWESPATGNAFYRKVRLADGVEAISIHTPMLQMPTQGPVSDEVQLNLFVLAHELGHGLVDHDSPRMNQRLLVDWITATGARERAAYSTAFARGHEVSADLVGAAFMRALSDADPRIDFERTLRQFMALRDKRGLEDPIHATGHAIEWALSAPLKPGARITDDPTGSKTLARFASYHRVFATYDSSRQGADGYLSPDAVLLLVARKMESREFLLGNESRADQAIPVAPGALDDLTRRAEESSTVEADYTKSLIMKPVGKISRDTDEAESAPVRYPGPRLSPG